MGEIGQLTFIRRLNTSKRSRIQRFRFQNFIRDDLATSHKNLVNFGPVTLEFTNGKDVHPKSISSLATRRHC